MRKKTLSKVASTALAFTILTAPGISSAQQSTAREENSPFVLGSILLSIIHIPVKLVTCVGAQVTGAEPTSEPTESCRALRRWNQWPRYR